MPIVNAVRNRMRATLIQSYGEESKKSQKKIPQTEFMHYRSTDTTLAERRLFEMI